MIDWKNLKINYSSIGHRFEVSPESVGISALLKKSLEGETGCVSHFYQEGYSDKAFETMLKKIADLKGRKVYENISILSEEHLFAWGDAFVEITNTKSKLMTINVVSTNETITAACKEVAAMFSAPAKKGYVFAITKNAHGLGLTRIGYAGSTVEKNNYTESVQKDYDYIIEDLRAKDPTGRIVILDGPPGTGKTYLIRGILMDVPRAMFVIVPPNMIASIGGPELLPLLLRTREDYGKKGPTVLILEDADQCLAPRQSDNISAISSILNLGDGIFGSLFDVRIVATTNGKAKELDVAITRDMRLSKRISINPFAYDEANRVYKRIFKDDSKELPKPMVSDHNMRFGSHETEQKLFSLAQIYKLARNNGWKPEKSEEPTSDSKSNMGYADEEFDDGADYL